MAKDKPRIKLGIPNLHRTRALIEGKVELEGYELDITHEFKGPGDRHNRFNQGEFDVGEFSTATYLRTREKSDRFTALPIFWSGVRASAPSFTVRAGSIIPASSKVKKSAAFATGLRR